MVMAGFGKSMIMSNNEFKGGQSGEPNSYHQGSEQTEFYDSEDEEDEDEKDGGDEDADGNKKPKDPAKEKRYRKAKMIA